MITVKRKMQLPGKDFHISYFNYLQKWRPETAAQHFLVSPGLIVQHFPIINHVCFVPFIFKAICLPTLPVLCILSLYRREWTIQADLSLKPQPPTTSRCPTNCRPYTSIGSGTSSAQWVTNLQVVNQTADKHMKGTRGVGRRRLCRWIDRKMKREGRIEMTMALFHSPPWWRNL